MMRVNADATPPHGVGSSVFRRAAFKLLPFLSALYFLSYLDRVNISFAAIQMNADLSLSAAEFGIGAGIFFLGYVAFQVPSNVLLQKYGARRWLAVIVLVWGLASMSTSFIRSAHEFYLVRFMLGLAEAGFFPGLVLYLTSWFPPRIRGRVMAGLLVSIPLAAVLGAPISGMILKSFDGVWAWDGWRWMFFIEAFPALLAAVLVWIILPNGPESVAWLSDGEKRWLARELETSSPPVGANDTALRALVAPYVLRFMMVYFSIGLGLYGVGLWLPQIIASSGASETGAVFLTAIPYAVAACTMIVWSQIADRNPTAPRNCAIPIFLSGIALGLLTIFPSLTTQILLLSVAAGGTLAALAAFWTLPTAAVPTKHAGIIIAAINVAGSIGGFFGPFAVGWLKDITGGFSAGLMVLALSAIAGALLLMLPAARPKNSGAA